jgi:glycosyltransferase involved in cell wall biosynthesis
MKEEVSRMVSVICVYNKKNMLEEQLLRGISLQNTDYELVLVDNSHNEFSSAAKALNYGAQKARGDIFVFCHQDILFEESEAIERIEKTIKKFNGNVVVGAAGRDEEDYVVTNITHGYQREFAGSKRVEYSAIVQVLDEVLLACSREVFEQILFDEVSCDDWHFYAIDFCLSARTKGIPSVVIPLKMHHFSQGKLSVGYFHSLLKVAKKHRKEHKIIRCTMSTFKTNLVGTYYYVLKHMMSLKLKGQI